ncbi:MAG: hypothetical protein GWN00_19755 [Aliifodinibius sp.]|nr:hypothetical protein [Fodinibius sp.]NIY26958.1 hypothetical protein [Fodinibius sp.]
MSSPSPPPAPDYEGMAEATAAGNLAAMEQATFASRPDEFTPLGSRQWTYIDPVTAPDEAAFQAAQRQHEQDLAKWYAQSIAGGDTPRPTAPTQEQYMTTVTPARWQSDITLTPELQEIFGQNIALQGTLADLGITSAEQMRELMGTPFRIGAEAPQYAGPTGPLPTLAAGGDIPTYQGPEGPAPAYGETRQRVMDAMLSRVTSDIERDRGTRHSQLISQGIPPGSEAYNREMERFDRQLTDARQQAEIAATGMAGQEFQAELAGRRLAGTEAMERFMTDMQSRGVSRQDAMDMFNSLMRTRGVETQEALTGFGAGMDVHRQRIQDALLQRQIPLNELSAFRSGSQVQLPQFQAFAPQAPTAGPDYLGAGQMQSAYDLANYNAQLAQQNQLMGGLFGLGAGMAAGGTGFFA